MPVRNLFIIALTAIVTITCYFTASRNRYANLFAEAVSTIEREALQAVPQQDLFASAMNGMASRLDGHSRFIAGEEFRRFNEDLEQEFGGVGMYVDLDPGTGLLTVLAPIPDTPAFKAGILAGDTILEISGKSTADMDRAAAIEMIRGPKGAVVEVLIGRDGQQTLHRLERDSIREASVQGDFRNADGTWNFHLKDYPRLGYLRLLQFGNQSAAEMEAAVKQLSDNVDWLIFDLRDNSGGLLDGAIAICDLFLEPGDLIVTTRGRGNELREEFFAATSPVFPMNKPLVILVNRDSASASEIVAACLQDNQRAIVIGESTWGKGTVQHVIPIQRGRSALKLTTASYWRPNGKSIDRFDPVSQKSGTWGVQPNEGMHIEMTPEESFRHRMLRSLLDLRGLVDPAVMIERDEEKILETVDQPLQRAIKFLNETMEKRIAA